MPNLEEDLQYYAIYRSEEDGFEPEGLDPLAFVYSETYYSDSSVEPNQDYFYRISAFDHSGNQSEFSDIATANVFVNQSPSIQEIPNQSINEDAELVVSLAISDPEEDELTIDVQSDQEAVQGMVEESNLSITLDEDWYGSAQITVSVSDGEFTVETGFELMVSPVNDMPGEFALISPSDGSTVTITSDNLGELLQFEWEESIDVDGDELTYTFSGYND